METVCAVVLLVVLAGGLYSFGRQILKLGVWQKILIAVLIVTPLALVAYSYIDEYYGRKIPKRERSFLQDAEYFELLLLDPEGTASDDDDFLGWKVVGRTVVDADTQKKLFKALDKGARKRNGFFVAPYSSAMHPTRKGAGPHPELFHPRYGIRVRHNGVTVEFVIETNEVRVEKGEVFAADGGSTQPVFDEVLRAAGILK